VEAENPPDSHGPGGLGFSNARTAPEIEEEKSGKPERVLEGKRRPLYFI
jgi:hypothetical protein